MCTILFHVAVSNWEIFLGIGMNTGTGITGREVAAEVEAETIVTGTVGRKEIVAVGAEAAVQVLIITRIVGEADMMMSAVVAAGHMEGIILCSSHALFPPTKIPFVWEPSNCFLISVSWSASPARRSPSPRGSPSPRRTPPSREESPVGRKRNERSPTPKSVSPRGRTADSRSPSPHNSDADVSPKTMFVVFYNEVWNRRVHWLCLLLIYFIFLIVGMME